jgi:hypothetical protein
MTSATTKASPFNNVANEVLDLIFSSIPSLDDSYVTYENDGSLRKIHQIIALMHVTFLVNSASPYYNTKFGTASNSTSSGWQQPSTTANIISTFTPQLPTSILSTDVPTFPLGL